MSASRVGQGRGRGPVPCESPRDRAWRSRSLLVVIACVAPHGRPKAHSAIQRQKTTGSGRADVYRGEQRVRAINMEGNVNVNGGVNDRAGPWSHG